LTYSWVKESLVDGSRVLTSDPLTHPDMLTHLTLVLLTSLSALRKVMETAVS